jgi:hypothetical protein
MANLTITTVHIVRMFEMEPDGPVNEVVAAGKPVRVDATTGFYTPGNATTTTENALKGIATNTGDYANATITVMKRGILDVGNALSAVAYGATVFLSDTDGTLADTAGTVSTIVGYVIPGFGSTTPDKLLLVNI